MESPRGLSDPALGDFKQALADADVVFSLGKRIDFSVNFGEAFAADCRILVVDADAEGNLRTDLTAQLLSDCPRGPEVTISCGGHSTNSIFPNDHEQQEMTYIAVLCSDGILTLSLVGDSAAKFLGIRSGDKVVVKW